MPKKPEMVPAAKETIANLVAKAMHSWNSQDHNGATALTKLVEKQVDELVRATIRTQILGPLGMEESHLSKSGFSTTTGIAAKLIDKKIKDLKALFSQELPLTIREEKELLRTYKESYLRALHWEADKLGEAQAKIDTRKYIEELLGKDAK